MDTKSKLIALVIFSFFGVSYGAENDIKTITAIMDAYEAQLDPKQAYPEWLKVGISTAFFWPHRACRGLSAA